jgi:hypothetical protein
LENRGSHEISAGPPVILSKAAAGCQAEGAPLLLDVIAGGARPLTYEWSLNGQILTSPAGPRLEQAALSRTNAGIYRVRISNGLGFKESEPMEVKFGYGLSVRTLGPGHVSGLPEGAVYAPGTIVQLTAFPDGTRRFTGWSGDLTSSENPLSVTLNASLRLFANFECLPGDKKWEFTAGGMVNSCPAIAADGTLYVGSDDGKLCAWTAYPERRNGNLKQAIGFTLRPLSVLMEPSTWAHSTTTFTPWMARQVERNGNSKRAPAC